MKGLDKYLANEVFSRIAQKRLRLQVAGWQGVGEHGMRLQALGLEGCGFRGLGL